MDAARWFRNWSDQHDGFPDDYITIDLESTGLSINKDLIIQLGWCEVVNREPINNSGVILNWDKSPLVDTNWLQKRMESTSVYMSQELGKEYPWTYDDLLKGTSPITALTNFYKMLVRARNEDKLIVAHNGISFDVPMIMKHFDRFLDIRYSLFPTEIWDTGALEKASQIDELLCDGELPGDFAYRLILRSNDYGIQWNLHEHCISKYMLDKVAPLDMSKAHTAPFDAFVTHLLFEQYRYLSDGVV